MTKLALAAARADGGGRARSPLAKPARPAATPAERKLAASTAAKPSAAGAQGDRADAGGDVQAGIAFDTDRLQRDRPVRAADQHIDAGPDPGGGARRGAGEIAGERAGRDADRRREHRP